MVFTRQTQAGCILVTPVGETNPQLIPAQEVFSIYERDDASSTFVRFFGVKNPLEIQESITDIWDEQDGDGNNLNMVLITEATSSRRVIYFTHHMKQIVSYGEGAKISFHGSYDDVYTAESLADIYAYQGNSGLVNLGMLFVTRKSDSVEFIEFWHNILNVRAYPVTGVVTGSTLSFDPHRDPVVINETVANLYANQAK